MSELLGKLGELQARAREVEIALASPDIWTEANREKTRGLQRELKHLEPIVAVHGRLARVSAEIATGEELMPLTSGEEREALQAELERLRAEQEALETEARRLLVPRDPRDDRPVILEVRAGTGGQEAMLFAFELVEMYRRFAERHGWTFQTIDWSEAELGGLKEGVFEIEGDGAYTQLKFESGTHRVQRVPVTESQGRIHTSAATVAVLSEPDPADIHIDDKDLRVDFYRSSGAGGQHVNKTSSAVRITHLPTGIVVSSQDQRSQHQNKDKCLQVLAAKLHELEEERTRSAQAASRAAQIGSGDRSEKIRTYNYPQNRVTDHRINKSIHNLPAVLAGDLDELVTDLVVAAQAEQLGGGDGEA